jgi:Trypsin-like peptidase domain
VQHLSISDNFVWAIGRYGRGHQKEFRGTGIVVSPGLILTCAHILGGQNDLMPPKTPLPGEFYACRNGVEVAGCELYLSSICDFDLCCLRFKNLPDVEPVRLARASELGGTRLKALGYISDSKRRVLKNLLVKHDEADDADSSLQAYVLDATLPKGVSGGPVLCKAKNGWVAVGVAELGGERASISRVIAVDRIAEFLASKNLNVPIEVFEAVKPPAKEIFKPSGINTAIFILTACPFLAALLATATVAAWLLLSDFFLAREGWGWASWANYVAFLPVALFVLFLITTTTRSIIFRKAGVQGAARELKLNDRPIWSWCEILQQLAGNSHGISQRYFRWLKHRLLRLDPNRQVSHDRIGRVWRELSPAGLKNLRGVAWVPLLVLVLIFPQLHSPLMEQLSRLFSRKPSSPLVAFNRYYDHQLGVQEEVLEVNPRFGFWRPKTALIGGRCELFFKNADFPRTNRQICVAEFMPNRSSTQRCLAVRRGMAEYDFVRTDRQPLLDLEVTLEPYIGEEFYRIYVEHIRR